ncbi:Oxidoreductase FAD/NAD(P)-binding [Penicillium verhagenii]|nr:Oxidoreductase FAD/NAD(P)-binding [Penicillium verhagenii]
MGKPMEVYFGGNTGTCEALAQRQASDAAQYGDYAELNSLDAAMQFIPLGQPVVVVRASYEDKAQDNVAKDPRNCDPELDSFC